MPTFLLDGGDAARLPLVPVRVRISTAASGGATLELRSADGGGTAHVQPQPDFLVLSTVGAPATLVAVAPSEKFGDDVTVSLELDASRLGQTDGERAVLSRVPVGGMREQVLVVVERVDDALVIRAPQRAADDIRLTPLGSAARAETAARLGSAILSRSQTRDVRIAVDASASFRVRLADRSLRALLEVLSGVITVVAAERRVFTVLAGSEPGRWAECAPDQLVERLTQSMAASPRSTRVAWPDVETSSVAYLMTDGSGRVPVSPRSVPVVLESEAVWLAGRSVASPVALVSPPPRGDLGQDLLADRALLQLLVSALLTPWTTSKRNGGAA